MRSIDTVVLLHPSTSEVLSGRLFLIGHHVLVTGERYVAGSDPRVDGTCGSTVADELTAEIVSGGTIHIGDPLSHALSKG